MSDTDKRLGELQAEIDKLQAEKNRLQGLTPAQRVAEALHQKMCGWNHTDGCSWFYESDWKAWAHAKYLEMAENALGLMNGDEQKVLEMARILKS